tara:strand:- start:488 stop:763 length:276 start_codon:yes stop_codon:yes gene_type:complete
METAIMSVPDPTTIGLLITAVTGCASAIGVLWKQVMKHIVTIEGKLKDCEDDRNDLWKELAKQAGCNVDDMRPKNYGSSEDQRKTSTRNER